MDDLINYSEPIKNFIWIFAQWQITTKVLFLDKRNQRNYNPYFGKDMATCGSIKKNSRMKIIIKKILYWVNYFVDAVISTCSEH